jgi:hypothetical protein
MKKLILIFIIMLLITTNCKKEQTTPHTKISGHVYSTGSGKPIEGVKIYMYDGIGHSGGMVDLGGGNTGGSSRRDSTVTDANGYFHIELDGEEPVLYLFKQGYSFEYIVDGAVIGIIPLYTGESKNLEFEMDAWANFNPWFKGSKSLPYDTILFDVLSKSGIKEGWLSTFYGNGPHKFSSFDGYPTKGDKYKAYWLKYQINGIWHERVDSVYIPSFTTYTDTIYY